jgi:SNF2 family DNA or RNA helicase
MYKFSKFDISRLKVKKMKLPINYSTEWEEGFLKRFDEDGQWSSHELFQLSYEIEKNTLITEFEGLQSIKYLPHLTIYNHQLEVARNVIEDMNGKAILADEVGLGKTIEAGLILKELMIRGLVKKALILVPASLVSQWAFELNQKFYIPAIPQKKEYVWETCDVVVSSIDTAKRNPHKDIVLNQNYDLVIIDEAHKLKNAKTKNYEFVKLLKKKFCLLLTATPVQNRIEEIFNLVSLLKPGHLGNEKRFGEKYEAKNRKFTNDEHLKKLVNSIMIRNRRADTGMEWPKRVVHNIKIDFSKTERELYESIRNVRTSEMGMSNAFTLLTLEREACSSREAVYMTLKKWLQEEDISIYRKSQIDFLMEKIHRVEKNSKAEKAVEIIKSINDKVIIFTEYRATQVYLQWYLKQNGITSVPFRGGFKRGKKDWMKELFKERAQVLIATEAGGEGINLQFCSNMINYDLPWNPMRLEQRIGRIHRLGQENDVHIYNFSTKDTIEEQILNLLYEKINLFERVVGELDDILEKIKKINIEEYITDAISYSSSKKEVELKMHHLTELISEIDEDEEELDAAK